MIIGIIGGIGSGKSLATDYLGSQKGFQTVKTDLIAFEIMEQNGAVKRELIKAFGSGIYLPDGKLDRISYGKILYGSPENRKRSDAVVHPAVWKKVAEQTEGCKRVSAFSDAAVETALPSEILNKLCDEVWYIRAGEETRIRRLMASRNYTRDRAVSVINNQPREDVYRNSSDRVLDNEGSPENLFALIELNLNEIRMNPGGIGIV